MNHSLLLTSPSLMGSLILTQRQIYCSWRESCTISVDWTHSYIALVQYWWWPILIINTLMGYDPCKIYLPQVVVLLPLQNWLPCCLSMWWSGHVPYGTQNRGLFPYDPFISIQNWLACVSYTATVYPPNLQELLLKGVILEFRDAPKWLIISI